MSTKTVIKAEPEMEAVRLGTMRWVRRFSKLFAVFAVALLLFVVTGASDRLVLYARILKLYTQAPDTRLAMPLEDVRKTAIADTWQAARGVGRKHEGQDIFAPKGTPILSATSGYIYNIGENNLGGQTVSVISKGGRIYYYAHLDSYARGIKMGDRVTTRTVLGYVGTTGNAQGTPPHLHFGVYTSSGAINPLPMLTDRLPPTATRQETRPRSQLINRKA
ncbi:MAG TPA: M23 family metallopeptidase [Pyrinomonadaceae bacterium]|nr:M23 family metallopeptidase [Pyrinomonadaceae bacterium]